MEAPTAKSRAGKNRESAETSRTKKRELLADKTYLREKAEAGVESPQAQEG